MSGADTASGPASPGTPGTRPGITETAPNTLSFAPESPSLWTYIFNTWIRSWVEVPPGHHAAGSEAWGAVAVAADWVMQGVVDGQTKLVNHMPQLCGMTGRHIGSQEP
eukprot:1153067-Pelagomonas_calceolata.AAC.3